MSPADAHSRADRLVPAILFAGYIALFVWGAIGPYDRATWWAENIPIVVVVLALVLMYARGIRFSPLAYVMMAVLPYWHTVGGHYTFERVPFDWFNRAFGFERNMFDRIGHFSVGFYAFGIVEYLLSRRAMSRPLACLFALFAIAFVAMSYELIEWTYAAYGGDAEAGANFLGSQGDIWDAQKDMLMDTLGAVAAIVLFLVVRGRGRVARHSSLRALALLVAAALPAVAQQPIDVVRLQDDAVRHTREYLRINTANPPGNEAETIRRFARIFAREGIPFDTASAGPRAFRTPA